MVEYMKWLGVITSTGIVIAFFVSLTMALIDTTKEKKPTKDDSDGETLD